MAVKISKSRRKKLRLQRAGSWGSKLDKTQRNMQRRLDNLAAASADKLDRPSCKLDAQAVELGVYDLHYHCLPRKERKRIVSTALSKARAA